MCWKKERTSSPNFSEPRRKRKTVKQRIRTSRCLPIELAKNPFCAKKRTLGEFIAISFIQLYNSLTYVFTHFGHYCL